MNKMTGLAVLLLILGCQSTLPVIDGDHRDIRYITTDSSEQTVKEMPVIYATIQNILDGETPVRDLYRQDITHDAVVNFFSDLTDDPDLAQIILFHANETNISMRTFFSLAWVESNFNIRAVNSNSSSIDRGLFQLNSQTFRQLSEEDFFNPDVNARHAAQYFRGCLEIGRSDAIAIAIYNAGAYRILNGLTPTITKRHVSKVLAYRDTLSQEFHNYIIDLYAEKSS